MLSSSPQELPDEVYHSRRADCDQSNSAKPYEELALSNAVRIAD